MSDSGQHHILTVRVAELDDATGVARVQLRSLIGRPVPDELFEDFADVRAAAFWGEVIESTNNMVLIAALVPQQLAAMRRRILDAPFRTLWLGFLTQSAVIGSAVLFAMTLVGVFLSPAALLVAAIGGFAGYVVGVYAFGVGLLLAWGWDEPASIGRRALAAGFGALVAGVIGLIPVLGWIFLLAVSLAGVGAITTWIFRPRFFGALPSE